jgi:hypothetical protein
LYLVGSRMFRPESTSAKLLLVVAASVFLLGIFATELPELLTLSDNASNDFAMRKAGATEFVSTTSAASQAGLQLNLIGPEYRTDLRCASVFEDSKPASSNLFFLHSVVRI